MTTSLGVFKNLSLIISSVWYLVSIFIFATIFLIQEFSSYTKTKKGYHFLYAKGTIFIITSILLAVILTLKLTPPRTFQSLTVGILIAIYIILSFYFYKKAMKLQKFNKS